jgi:LPS export ABC transporter protein LptC
MFNHRLISLVFLVFLFPSSLYAQSEAQSQPQQGQNVQEQTPQQEAEQQISEFSLAGYGEKGKKTWDVSGKTADIFTDIVRLQYVVGNLYGEDEEIKLTADKGDFNKEDGKVHLEQNVVITTSSGAKLTTNALDWDRKGQFVSTDDIVNIVRDNIVTVASGAKGEPNLKKISLARDVKLDINPANPDKDQGGGFGNKEKITITCDGPLEIDYEKNIASFKNNVKVDRSDALIYSDKMDVYFIASGKKTNEPEKGAGFMGDKIDKIIATGNVKVIRGENVSYSQEAIYTASDRKIVLTGRPKLVIYSEGDLK